MYVSTHAVGFPLLVEHCPTSSRLTNSPHGGSAGGAGGGGDGDAEGGGSGGLLGEVGCGVAGGTGGGDGDAEGGGDGDAEGGGDGEADGGGGGDGEADGGGQSDEPSQNHVGSGGPSQVVPTYLQYRNPGLGGFAYQLLRTLLSHSSLLAE